MSAKGLKIVHINIRSLAPKIDLLRTWVALYKPHVVSLSETWLHNNINNNDIAIDNYILFRSDRPSRAGGVATYVTNKFISEYTTPTVDPNHFESLFINILFHDNKHLTIGTIYRPPPVPAGSANDILATINSLNKQNELIILGDFNVCWLKKSSLDERSLFTTVQLTQLIKDTTRVDPYHKTKSLLDWILVTNPERITSSGVMSDCFSDHSIIFCVWKIKIPKAPPKFITLRQYKKMDTDNFINDTVEIDWDRFQLIPFAEDACSFLSSELTKVIDKHAPLKTFRVKGRHLPWISTELLNLFKQRDKAWAKYHLSNSPADWDIYKGLRNTCTTKTRNAKSSYYSDSLSRDFNNPRHFWKQLNCVLNKTNKNPISQLKINGDLISDPLHIAEAFNNHFITITNTINTKYSDLADSSNPTTHTNYFSFIKILPMDVYNVISEFKSGSAGPDGIEAKFVKLAAHVLMYPLADLFNLSLSTASIPSLWKCARVTPIFKNGSATDMNNYRPISIISFIAKVFEKLIFIQLSHFLESSNILSPFQSGFRPNFSTTTALLKFTSDVFSFCDRDQLTGAIFIDLSKAFDLVDHYLLLDKLHSIGFSRNALLWFNAYLHNRRQCVSIQGSQSDYLIVDKGIPQGSTLGPLLFSIFINDLPMACPNSHIHMYADDTVIYSSHNNLSQIQRSLQSDFQSIQNWFHNNKLVLNKTKSCSMVFGSMYRRPHLLDLNIVYDDGSPLENVKLFKYLGVWIDPELTFKLHIDSVIKKAYGCLGSLYRSIDCFTLKIRMRLISQLILPIIDYADIVYQNTCASFLIPLNVLFNSLCRFVLRCNYYTHHCHMYDQLDWFSLDSRRQLHWLQFIFKCIHFNYPVYLKAYLVPRISPYPLRQHQHLFLCVPRINKELGRKSFAHKAPNDWNNLPPPLRSITSLRSFKGALLPLLKKPCTCL